MLRQAFRRLLWILPVALGVTLATFILLSYLPDTADAPTSQSAQTQDDAEKQRQTRFLDLPLFVNRHPTDVRDRVMQSLRLMETGQTDRGEALLARIGGAGFPYLLGRLSDLKEPMRKPVARALSVVARRMGLPEAPTESVDAALTYWKHYWKDRSIEFRPANARRAVRRLALNGTPGRLADVIELDTYALEPIIVLLSEMARSAPTHSDATPISDDVLPPSAVMEGDQLPWNGQAVVRLLDALDHMTGRAAPLTERATHAQVLDGVRHWQGFWQVYRNDYATYSGLARAFAVLTDTQYARWTERALFVGYGDGEDGAPALLKLRQRTGPTALLVAGSMAFAYATAILFGLFFLRRARAGGAPRLPLRPMLLPLLVYALPTTCLAVLLARSGTSGQSVLLGVVLLGSANAAPALAQVRVAIARLGGSCGHARCTARATWLGDHTVGCAVRTALLPLLALGSTELATTLGGAFVIEHALGIRGLGQETIRAIQDHDIGWLTVTTACMTITVALATILADLAAAAVHPAFTVAAQLQRRGVE